MISSASGQKQLALGVLVNLIQSIMPNVKCSVIVSFNRGSAENTTFNCPSAIHVEFPAV